MTGILSGQEEVALVAEESDDDDDEANSKRFTVYSAALENMTPEQRRDMLASPSCRMTGRYLGMQERVWPALVFCLQ